MAFLVFFGDFKMLVSISTFSVAEKLITYHAMKAVTQNSVALYDRLYHILKGCLIMQDHEIQMHFICQKTHHEICFLEWYYDYRQMKVKIENKKW